MKNNILTYFAAFAVLLCITANLSSCKKDDYYVDGGKAEAKFNGSILQYLESKPTEFDSVVQVIKLAGMEDVFSKENITFFAPNDRFIKQTIQLINPDLRFRYLDTIKTLSDIKPEIWRKYLMRYVFKGSYLLADYPQIDLQLKNLFPGQNYLSYNEYVFNIGLIYNDANGITYIGYRELAFHYIPDVSTPNDNWVRGEVSSTDIQPSNGVVHTLAYSGFNPFGFSLGDFYQDVALSQ